MGLTSELKIRRFENVFLFFSFFKIGPKLRDPPPKIHPPKPETGTSEVLFVPEYNTWGGGWIKWSTLSPKRDAWKKLRKERKKFSKLLIFSTDCSQPMGLQSVIKIRGKTSKLFALHASPYKGTVFTSDPECLRKERPAAVFNLKKKQIIVFRAWLFSQIVANGTARR